MYFNYCFLWKSFFLNFLNYIMLNFGASGPLYCGSYVCVYLNLHIIIIFQDFYYWLSRRNVFRLLGPLVTFPKLRWTLFVQIEYLFTRTIPANFGSLLPCSFRGDYWNIGYNRWTTDGDRRQVMTITHMTLRTRWAKNSAT